uniref:Uncharacterized protein n=1 Tax=Brassica campestris TaxID=3711 RepID=M4EWS1_BRACM
MSSLMAIRCARTHSIITVGSLLQVRSSLPHLSSRFAVNPTSSKNLSTSAAAGDYHRNPHSVASYPPPQRHTKFWSENYFIIACSRRTTEPVRRQTQSRAEIGEVHEADDVNEFDLLLVGDLGHARE